MGYPAWHYGQNFYLNLYRAIRKVEVSPSWGRQEEKVRALSRFGIAVSSLYPLLLQSAAPVNVSVVPFSICSE